MKAVLFCFFFKAVHDLLYQKSGEKTKKSCHTKVKDTGVCSELLLYNLPPSSFWGQGANDKKKPNERRKFNYSASQAPNDSSQKKNRNDYSVNSSFKE